MKRYETEDLLKIVDQMIYDIDVDKRHDVIDRHDLIVALEKVAQEIIKVDDMLGEKLQDAEDEARDAYRYQEIYQDALTHAEDHIAWMEMEFDEELDDSDKYQRDC